MAPGDGGVVVSRHRTARSTGDRLRRLLVMLPWLMERGEAPVAEMVERFGLTEAELVRDLELAAMCGLPPFVDEMIDVFIDDGVVYAGVPRVFVRPLRLTAPEGFGLVAASRLAMELPGADPHGALARALAKLEHVLGGLGVVVDVEPPAITDVVVSAAQRCERLQIGYWSEGERFSEREITPRRVLADRGNWYVVADDHASGEERIFRLDRIDGCVSTGVLDEPRDVDAPVSDEWFKDADLPSVRLLLAPSAGWVVERYPTRSVRETADGVEVELTVTRERWLRELLLRLGTAAQVVEPERWRDLGARAATAVLARYGDGGANAAS